MKFNLTMLPLDIVVASAFVSSKDKKLPLSFFKTYSSGSHAFFYIFVLYVLSLSVVQYIM